MLDRFPGTLCSDNGVIAIHADWPNYPIGNSWKAALYTLGIFPDGTTFFEIDDIDKCKLLLNRNPSEINDPYDFKYYQIAVWHEDLIELKRKGLINGIIEKSENEYLLFKFEEFKKSLGKKLKLDNEGNILLPYKDESGAVHEVEYNRPKPDDEEDEGFISKNCVIIQEPISLTTKGLQELNNICKEIKLNDELDSLIKPLVAINKFDSAIRDASILIETKIKNFHNTPEKFGQKLIDFHINEVIKGNDNFNSAAIKTYRAELRMIFNFIRNDFAHNFKVLSEEQCRIILFRVSNLLDEFNEVISVYFK